jgi:MbtH protein
MTNPFESEENDYMVLRNQEGQCSLWPILLKIPGGWVETGQRGKRKESLDWIKRNWTDMRPKSLIEAMSSREKRSSTGS